MKKINKTLKWALDADYISHLTKEQKKWYRQFIREYYFSYFKKEESPIHNTLELKRCVYKANHAHRKCVNVSWAEEIKE